MSAPARAAVMAAAKGGGQAVPVKGPGRRKRRRLELKLVDPARADPIDGVFTKYLLFPAPGQKTFVFVLEAEKARLIGRGHLEQAVVALQRSVGSAASAFVIVEPGMELRIFEVVDPRVPGG